MRAYLAGLRLSFALIRRRLALLAAVCALLALIGQAAAAGLADAFSDDGRGIAGLRIALTGSGAEQAAALAGHMEDVGAYCSFEAMDEDAARQALEEGRLSAVLLIPEGFLDSVYSGENKALTLLVDERRPLEGYLARWAGECAIGVLMDAQAGIEAVENARIARKEAGFPPEKSRKEINREINLVYLGAALTRADLTRTETLSPTGALAPGDHYALSALAYLSLLAGAVLFPLYDERARRGFLQRLMSAGVSLTPLRLAALTVAALLGGVLLGVPLALLSGEGELTAALPGLLAGAVFAAGLGGVCAAACGHAGASALTLFLTATAALFVGGGLLPPALLPAPLRAAMEISPVRLAALALAPARGYDAPAYAAPVLLLGGLALGGLTLLLQERRHRREP